MVEVRRRRRSEEPDEEASAPRVQRRRRDVVSEDEDLDVTEVDEELAADDIDDEEDEEEQPRRVKKAAKKHSAARRRVVDEDDDEDDEERPRKGSKSSVVRHGWAGANETIQSSYGGGKWLRPAPEPTLVAFLQDEPMSWAQHWVDRTPHTCLGKKNCPLCGIGNQARPVVAFNVLHLTESEPEVKLLQLATRATKSLEDLSKNRKTNKPEPTRSFWSVSTSGKDQQRTTNFKPVLPERLEDEWPEILEVMELDDIEDAIEQAKKEMFDDSVIRVETRAELQKIARYLTEDD